MFCEAYNQSLTDAAARGEALSPALQQHLASCESCRAAFAEEQSVFAAIDSGLRAAANPEVPSTLIPRIRVAINNEPTLQARRFLLPVWGFAGVLVAAASVLALLYVPSRRPPIPVEPSRTSPPPIVAPANSLDLSVLNSSGPGGVSPLQHKKPVVLVTSHTSKPEFPEVLVPDEERAAFARYMAQISSSPVNISAEVMLAPKAPQESVQISPVEIASLKVKPLDEKEGRAGQF